MPLTEQFKRCVVGAYNSEQLHTLPPVQRALAAAEICRANLVHSGYLTRDSLGRSFEDMHETSDGKAMSSRKRSDVTHGRKMKQFKMIWAMAMAEHAEKELEGDRKSVV